MQLSWPLFKPECAVSSPCSARSSRLSGFFLSTRVFSVFCIRYFRRAHIPLDLADKFFQLQCIPPATEGRLGWSVIV